MGWSYVTATKTSLYAGSTLTSSSISVEADDLVVVLASDVACSAINDTQSNSYTLQTQLSSSGAELRTGYTTAGSTGSMTITATYGASDDWKVLEVYVFRPDSGETVSLDVSGTLESGWITAGSAITTSSGDTTGDDEVVISAFVSNSSGSSWTNFEIPDGTAVDASQEERTSIMGYRVLTSTLAGCEGAIDYMDSGGRATGQMLAFKAESSGTAHTKTLSDTLGVTDTLTTARAIVEILQDSLGVTDTISTARAIVHSLSDALGVTDTVATARVISVLLEDAEGVTDTLSTARAIVKTISDALSISDDYDTVGTFVKSLSESLGVTDEVVASIGLFATISDAIGITDEVTAQEVVTAVTEILSRASYVTKTIDRTSEITVTESYTSHITKELSQDSEV